MSETFTNTYWRQVQDYAIHKRVDLRAAFRAGGVSKATWYRTINGQTSMRKATADAVIKGVSKLAYAAKKKRS